MALLQLAEVGISAHLAVHSPHAVSLRFESLDHRTFMLLNRSAKVNTLDQNQISYINLTDLVLDIPSVHGYESHRVRRTCRQILWAIG